MKISRRYIITAAVIVLALFIFANSGFRTMVRRYWELHGLTSQIQELKKENLLLKREIYFLEHDQSYMERIARKELRLISPGEVEYRFKE